MWRILVVDDNFVNRKLLIEVLKEKAHCDIAANGREAIEAYDLSVKQNKPYDAILLDVAMPDIDGMGVLKHIRDNEQQSGILLGNGIPIFMVTAYKEPFLDAFNKGCDDYILKPIDPKDVIAKLEGKINQK